MLRILLLSFAILVSCNTTETLETKNEKIEQVSDIVDKNLSQDQLKSDKELEMQEFLNSTIGTAAVLVLVYIAGGVTFSPVWNWVKSKIPFINK